jgi:hypothetical protein
MPQITPKIRPNAFIHHPKSGIAAIAKAGIFRGFAIRVLDLQLEPAM